MPSKVRIVEVGPRDGLQNEKTPVAVADIVTFIQKLRDAGLQSIEGGAFVSAKWVPQMANTDKVLDALEDKNGIVVLVPNEKGMQAAIDAGVKEVAVFAAASEGFSQKNINCSIDESLERFKPVMDMAKKHGVKVRGYVSCVLGCPYDGDIAPAAVAEVTKKLYDMGCYEVSLGDTIGTGTPDTTRAMLQEVKKHVLVDALAVHFHDTHDRAIDNIRVALEEGVSVVDSAASGLGGCPYAEGATGNVDTLKVLALMEELKIETGVDAAKLKEAGRFIRSVLQKPAMLSGPSHPKNAMGWIFMAFWGAQGF